MISSINYVTIINIGNELLLGKTVNTNLSWMANQLSMIGININKAVIIPDETDIIHQALYNAWEKSSLIIITGGLGPTKDDITKKAVADFFNKELIYNIDIENQIRQRFIERNIEMPESNKTQAYVPANFTALTNSLGTAPGLKYEEGEKSLYCFPGVPFEMKNLFLTYLKPDIIKKYKIDSFYCIDIQTYELPESQIADEMEQINFDDINIAWLPQTGRVNIRLYGNNEKKIENAQQVITQKFHSNIWGINELSPQHKLHNIITKLKITLSTAESCTGGLIAKMITEIPGASSYFEGSAVVYSNKQKENLLQIEKTIIEQNGAVSQETLEAMLTGCQKLFNTNLVCAVTGIAGPEGGTADKPVGTVFIGIKFNDKLISQKCFFTGTRELIRFKTAEKAIFMMIALLETK
ncbi:MAG: CinA family nicotinamide mononucleotide deamidase-related protein [Candidatus Cloacimonetes bacterium]|jgi:nicotinamide-nucleotide amidase|nr:CinA family nicotinamide mononucleotide deamidase-related protein [Candidatus Cloacimonadota bacterium]MDD4154974.1 CinA family nicotinamide mononucleotide deamidase-related protein [Candidatus Cloacimonadota bacterium]